MWKSLFNRDDDRAQTDMPHDVPPASFVERMTDQLDRIRWHARGSGARLPVEVLPQLGRIEDVVVPLLHHLELNRPSVEEEVAVEALLGDYLPTTLNTYMNLNARFAREPRADGRTPGDDLLDQLVTLEAAARDLSRAVYAHDAQDLQSQGRFLRTRFDQSDLAL